MASEVSRPATVSAVSAPPTIPAAAAAVGPSRLPPLYPQSSLFHAFRRCWLWASVLGLLVGGLVGTLWWFSIAEQYSAEMRVRVPASWSATDGGNVSEEELSRLQRTQSALIQSTTVLEAVLRKPEVAALSAVQQEQDPLAWLGNHLRVTVSSIPDVLVLRVHGTRSDEAVVLVQAIADAYRNTASNQRQASLRQLRDALGRAEEFLRQKRHRLGQLENTRLVAAEKECQQARFDLRVARAELTTWQKRLPDLEGVHISDEALVAALKEDAIGNRQLRQLETAEEQIKQFLRVSVLKERDPGMAELYRHRDEARKNVQARREEIRSKLERNERARLLEKHQAELNRRRERVALCEGLLKSLDEEVQGLGGAVAAEELKTLREETAAAGERLRILAVDRERLESTAVPAMVGEAGETIAVLRNDPKGRLQAASLGGAGCCALVMLAVSWRELRLRRITSGSDIAAGIDLPVLGNVPGIGMRRTLSREQLEGGGRLSEALDALRTVLLHDGGKGSRVLLVTSAVGGEGKTSLASLLAASLARAWRKTLLLDADLRKPEAHQLFHTELEPGLSEVLRGEAEPADVIQPTDLSRLWMISAGHWNAHAVQALAQDGAGRLFDPLKEQFDFIVIDACPILPVADALLLCTHVDAVLLAVRSGVSRLPVVQAARQRLAALEAPLRGAVLMGRDNDLDRKAGAYESEA
jgi:capsular exopolysaccharide synthesis family protein